MTQRIYHTLIAHWEETWGDIAEADKNEKNITELDDVERGLWVAGVDTQVFSYNGKAQICKDLHVYDLNELSELDAPNVAYVENSS